MNEQETTTAIIKEAPSLWKDSDGKRWSDDQLFAWVRKTQQDKESEYQVIVGTDSHLQGRQFRFITVVCVYRVGKGGNYVYLESYEPRENYILGPRGKKSKGNQKMRMFSEVERSITWADRLFEMTQVIPVVHIDASPRDKAEFTSEFSDQLAGYVAGAGYECRVKPDSWVANAVADRHTK